MTCRGDLLIYAEETGICLVCRTLEESQIVYVRVMLVISQEGPPSLQRRPRNLINLAICARRGPLRTRKCDLSARHCHDSDIV